MTTNDKLSEAVTGRTKDPVDSVADDSDVKDEEITDQVRITMKNNLENAGYKERNAGTE
jgi:hypothetical protein